MNKGKRIELKKKYGRKPPRGFLHGKHYFYCCVADDRDCRCKEMYELKMECFQVTHKCSPKYTREPTKLPKSGHFGHCFNKEQYSLAKDWKYLKELKGTNIKIIYLNHDNGPLGSLKVMDHFKTLRTPLLCIEVDIDDERAVDGYSYFGSNYKRSYKLKYNRNRKKRKEYLDQATKGKPKGLIRVETGVYDKAGHTNGRRGQWPNKYRFTKTEW